MTKPIMYRKVSFHIKRIIDDDPNWKDFLEGEFEYSDGSTSDSMQAKANAEIISFLMGLQILNLRNDANGITLSWWESAAGGHREWSTDLYLGYFIFTFTPDWNLETLYLKYEEPAEQIYDNTV